MLAEMAQAFRDHRASASDMVERSLGRIARLDPPLNAVVLVCADQARSDAARIDDLSDRTTAGPLAGLPLLVKDVHDVAGLPTTHGSLLHADNPPAADDDIVPARLRAAGAIVVGKTNTPEFAFEGYTANRLFGATSNPWGRQWSAGGSSGGSAAALAAGMVPVATASDGGGSSRIPAALCGLVGLKPTNGIIGRGIVPDWIDLTTDGIMATTVGDAELLLTICAGPTFGDPTAHPNWRIERAMPTRGFVADRLTTVGDPLPESVADVFRRAVNSLAHDVGVGIEPVASADVLGDVDPDADWLTVSATEQAHRLGPELISRRGAELDPDFLAVMEVGLGTSVADYLAARRRRFGLTRRVDTLLGRDAILVTPTVITEGFSPDGRRAACCAPGSAPGMANTVLQNITGHPAITVPAGRLPNGLPFGLQITAPRFRDGILIEVAGRWERANPWPLAAPGHQPFVLP